MELKEPLFPPMPPLSEEEARTNDAQFRREHHKKVIPSHSMLVSLFMLPLTILGIFGHMLLTRQSFDAELWKTADPYERTAIRERMSADLINSHILIGLNRAEVMTLLGKPDWEDEAEREIGYDTTQSAFDFTMLQVKLGSDNRVVDCSVEHMFL